MKVFFSGFLAASLFISGAAIGQTLATPPAATQQPPAKPADNKLGTKINALIKKQAPTAPTASAASQNVAKPALAAPTKTAAVPEAPAQTAPVPAPTAKESKVDRLITEREQLVLKYDYLKTQSSNFWGKASKEDMRAVIEALKEVLQKDEQIIQAVEQANLESRRSIVQRAAQLEVEAKKLNQQVTGNRRVITDNIYDLKTSLQNAQNLVKRKDRMIKDLEDQLQAAKDAKFEHDAIAAFFAMVCVLLVGYIVRLRGQLSNKQTKKHAKA